MSFHFLPSLLLGVRKKAFFFAQTSGKGVLNVNYRSYLLVFRTSNSTIHYKLFWSVDSESNNFNFKFEGPVAFG